MNASLNPILSRFVALALCLGLLGTIALGIAIYTGKSRDLADAAELDLQKYDRFRSVVGYDASALEAAANGNKAMMMLGNEPRSVITSSMQSRLRDMASALAVEVLQASELKPVELMPGLTKIGIRVDMVGPERGIHGIIVQIEASTPWLFLENVQLRSGYATSPEVEPALSLSTDIWGVITAPQTEPKQQ